MDNSLKNLQRQKKYLSNIVSSLKFKPYQNPGMELERAKTSKLIKEIEKARLKENKYSVLYNFCGVFDKLKLKSGDTTTWDTMHDWSNQLCFVKWFGAEASGPALRVTSSPTAVIKHKVYYDDDCNVIREEPYDGD